MNHCWRLQSAVPVETGSQAAHGDVVAKKCLGRAPSPKGKGGLTSCSAFYSRCCPGVGYGWVVPFLCFISPVCSALHSCLTLCDPMDCSPPGSSVHGSPQAGILEWVAISSSRGSSWCRGQTQVSCISCIGRQILYPLSHLGSLRGGFIL